MSSSGEFVLLGTKTTFEGGFAFGGLDESLKQVRQVLCIPKRC